MWYHIFHCGNKEERKSTEIELPDADNRQGRHVGVGHFIMLVSLLAGRQSNGTD